MTREADAAAVLRAELRRLAQLMALADDTELDAVTTLVELRAQLRRLANAVNPALVELDGGETSRSNRGGYWPTREVPPAWLEPVEAYEAWCAAAAHARGTIRTRRSYLDRLMHTHPDPWAVTSEDLARVLAAPQWHAPETKKSARAAFRGFYGWARLVGRLTHDPAAVLPSVRVPPGKPRPVPDDVVVQALERATPRQWLMLELGWLAGLRRAEIAQVHGRDVVDGRLRVRGKGGKVREVPLHPRLLDQLSGLGDRYAFEGRIDGHISAEWVGKQLGQLLGPGWSGHTLRHAAATRWYAVQRDLLACQLLLGHEKPETTARYTRVPDDALRAAVLGV